MSATLDEFLLAAEYILHQQDEPQVLLCLRGIRTFENKYLRCTMDLNALPILRRLTWLPIVVDPSHASGRRDLVLDTSQMAVAGKCNSFLIETHPWPDRALCDGKQSLDFNHFSVLYHNLSELSRLLNRKFT
jgi:3-deoxy-7-phosphoheptulonate synthase